MLVSRLQQLSSTAVCRPRYFWRHSSYLSWPVTRGHTTLPCDETHHALRFLTATSKHVLIVLEGSVLSRGVVYFMCLKSRVVHPHRSRLVISCNIVHIFRCRRLLSLPLLVQCVPGCSFAVSFCPMPMSASFRTFSVSVARVVSPCTCS